MFRDRDQVMTLMFGDLTVETNCEELTKWGKGVQNAKEKCDGKRRW